MATNIAKWNGSDWSALGSGVNSPVSALASSASDLYAGGGFTIAGGIPARNIAKWNGNDWSPLGSGMNGAVYALAVSGSDLYAGGAFTTAGGVPANCIAKWSGNSWSALGSGISGAPPNSGPSVVVFALAVSGGNLYAGGHFAMAGGMPAYFLAKWNGSNWSALGSGMGGGNFPDVVALAVSGNDLYAGGSFMTAGRKVSPYLARAVLGDANGCYQLAGTLLSAGDMQFSYVGDPFTEYALDRAFDLSPPVNWFGQQTNTMPFSGVLLFTNAPVPGTNNFWRVRSVP
jgi:hypothetical protein